LPRKVAAPGHKVWKIMDALEPQSKKKRAGRKLHVAPRCRVIIRKCPPTAEQIAQMATLLDMLWEQAVERARQESAAPEIAGGVAGDGQATPKSASKGTS
jgi:hypothetical protein